MSSGTINRTLLVRSDDGSQYVLREYRWPFDAPDDRDRSDKEAWLSDLVRRRGIPASRQLSRVRVGDAVVVLRVSPSVRCRSRVLRPGARRARRWPGFTRSGLVEMTVLESLRVAEFRPFAEGSWGRWQLANAVKHSQPVAERGTSPVLKRLLGTGPKPAQPGWGGFPAAELAGSGGEAEHQDGPGGRLG